MAGLYGLENVAHADGLLPTGATIIALPMKIKAEVVRQRNCRGDPRQLYAVQALATLGVSR